MNKTVAGGVVAWKYVGEDPYDAGRYFLSFNEPMDRREKYALVLASDLEACQQRCDEMMAKAGRLVGEHFIAREAAQTEADRLRVDAERYRWVRNNLMTESLNAHEIADYAYQQGSAHDFDAAIDTAIHAAKTEQERGE